MHDENRRNLWERELGYRAAWGFEMLKANENEDDECRKMGHSMSLYTLLRQSLGLAPRCISFMDETFFPRLSDIQNKKIYIMRGRKQTISCSVHQTRRKLLIIAKFIFHHQWLTDMPVWKMRFHRSCQLCQFKNVKLRALPSYKSKFGSAFRAHPRPYFQLTSSFSKPTCAAHIWLHDS